ncbi:nuclear transport factor 2 family protein [Kibdelosporangium philippinense]|uniref:Nuclear transport factor 2 family protein n=1 Tax=Kibdelosporangium philippinense TaxID=211113 RepID=A0ABS8Z0Y8_9PSEU|nr:nuclear transport factor 2 family protein [Kibdelosporangium philippinense]MCE7001624.1 nuclear transport factor 2 family protein [Kibdelosporangium philippinense]
MTDARAAITEVVDNWVIWRDAGLWDELLCAWHEGGRMHTSWFRGPAPEFVERCRTAFDTGVTVHHTLGGTWTKLHGTRAIAQSKVTISQRVMIHNVLCDVVGIGRFYDFFEARDGNWRLVSRQPIYEKDRLDSVDGRQYPDMDHELLAAYPAGCRHMLYAQKCNGVPVLTDLPELRGPIVEKLYSAGHTWLENGPLAFH